MRLQRDSSGKLALKKGPSRKAIFAIGATLALVAIAVGGIQSALAAGGQVQHNYQQNLGEDGMYEENNWNPFPDDEFPGEPDQNRTGV